MAEASQRRPALVAHALGVMAMSACDAGSMPEHQVESVLRDLGPDRAMGYESEADKPTLIADSSRVRDLADHLHPDLSDATSDEDGAADALRWYDNPPQICSSAQPIVAQDTNEFVQVAKFDGWAQFVHDIDGDGRSELFVNSGAGNTEETVIDVLRLQRDGNMETTAELLGAFPVAAGDFNQDGTVDLVNRTNWDGGFCLLVLTSQPRSSAMFDSELAFYCPPNVRALDYFGAYDLDLDGAPELIVGDPRVFLKWTGGPEGFSTWYVDRDMDFPLSAHGASGQFTAGDYDRDGRADVVLPGVLPRPAATGVYHAAHRVLEYRGMGQFVPTLRLPMPANGARFAETGDLDGDGNADFVQGGSDADNLCWYIAFMSAPGDDEYVVRGAIEFRYDARSALPSVVLADTDGDGKQEVLFGLAEWIFAFQWDPASERFTHVATIRTCQECENFVVRADLDGDGIDEIVVTGFTYSEGEFIPREAISVWSRRRT